MHHHIGRTVGGDKVCLEVTLRERPEGLELSIVGETRTARGQLVSCGQSVTDLLMITEFATGWDRDRVGRLAEIWDRWHLNNMRPGCEHQRAAHWGHCPGHYQKGRFSAVYCGRDGEPVREDCRRDMLGHPCPVCGYKYGSAWIFEPLPEQVLDFIRPLADIQKD